jgi:adenylate cyclase
LQQGLHAADLPDHDALLAQAMEGAPVVTGYAMTDAESSELPTVMARFAATGGDPRGSMPAYRGAVASLPEIEWTAAGNGALNVSLSAGGVVRRLSFVVRAGSQIYPSLALEALRVAQGSETVTIDADPAGDDGRPADGIRRLRVGALSIPTNRQGEAWIYLTRPVPERFLPAWSVLGEERLPAATKGAIVLIGSTAIGLQDNHASPLGEVTPGVSIHAQLIEQVLHGVHLVRPDWAKGGEILLMIGLALLVLALGARIGVVWTAVIGGAAVAAAFGVSWYAFAEGRLLLDPVIPATAVIAVYLTFSLFNQLRAERDERWVRKAFASYVSPRLVDALVARPEALRLGGERRELSFVFTDLEGFTTLIERSEPATIIPVLNAYLDGMMEVAFRHDGTVDKIVGDALHIIFGAPLADPRHADRAVACALDLDRFACRFAEGQRAAGLAFGQTRIGVNTGLVTVGNFGGSRRFDYTAHGDVVNTAARLEGANKYLGTRICIADATAGACTGFCGRPAGDLVLKGKSQPIRCHEALSAEKAEAAQFSRYREAFARLEAGDEEAAAAGFRQVLALDPGDPLAALHLKRLQAGETGTMIVLEGK